MTKGFDGIPHFDIKLWIMLNRASHTLCIVIELMHIEIPPNSTTNKLWNVGVVVMDVPTFGAWVFFGVCTLCVCVYVFFYKKKWVGSHTSTSFKVFDTILMVFVKRFWACLVVSSCFCCSNVLSRFDFLISIQQTIWLHCSHIYVKSIK